MVLGTPSYMSPEQLAGKKIDGRPTSLARVTLFQMLAGRLRSEGESMTQLMFRHRQHAAPADPRIQSGAASGSCR